MSAKKNSPEREEEPWIRLPDVHRFAEDKAWSEELLIPAPLSLKAAYKMAHELRVHQIELEMMNEKLRTIHAELNASRARYFDLYDLAPVGYCTLTAAGIILEANLTVAALLEVDRGALIKQPISRFIHKDDQDIYYRHCKNLCETGGPHACELRMLKNTGTEFWAKLEVAARQCADGESDYRIVLSDITADKQVETTLLQRNRQLEVLSSVSQQINAVLEIPVVLRHLVSAAMELTGAGSGAAGQLLNEKIVFKEYNHSGRWVPIDYSFTQGYGVPGWVMQTRTCHVSNDAEHDPHVIQKIQKDLKFHNLVDVPIFSREGELLGCFELHNKSGGFNETDVLVLQGLAASASIAMGNASILAELKQTATALRESNELFSLFIKYSPIYSYIKEVSPDRSCLLHASDNFLQMIGLTQAEVIGKPMSELFPADRAAKILADDLAVVSGDKVLEVEESLNGGNYISIKFPIVQGSRTLLAGYTIDITETRRAEKDRKKMEARLSQLQKMEAVGRLAGGVAHDFNNMLQIILGNTELLLTLSSTDATQASLIKSIATAGRRAADFTKDLLAFASKDVVTPQVLDVNDAITAMLKPLQQLVNGDVDLFWTPSADPCFVKIDRVQLNRMMTNLIVNAREAIDEGGRISIQVEKTEYDEAYTPDSPEFMPSSYVLISVSDTGCGMDEDMLDCIFEPFFTTKPEYLGCGLGLACLYGIVRQNHGFIKVDSQRGKGTTFKIYLPSHALNEISQPKKNAHPNLPSGTETILLVDDEEVLLAICKNQLERLGYTVLAFTDPVEALDMGRNYKGDIHLLLSDVSMPKMPGPELLRRLSALRPQMKCMFMSGYAADILLQKQTVRDTNCNFLQKPFPLEDMSNKIRETLSQ